MRRIFFIGVVFISLSSCRKNNTELDQKTIDTYYPKHREIKFITQSRNGLQYFALIDSMGKIRVFTASARGEFIKEK
jgi:hypothetical protein